MLRLLDDGDLAARLGGAAQRAVRARFSASRMAQEYFGTYEALVARRGAR
jgi:hypothetical protein